MPSIWLYFYSLAAFFHILAFGLHYSFSRYFIRITFGYDYNFIILLSAAEVIPLIFSVGIGILADVIGRRKLIFIGFLGAGMYLLIAIKGFSMLIFAIIIAMLSTSIVSVSVSGAVMDVGRMRGLIYAFYTSGMTIGWGLSGILLSILPVDVFKVYILIFVLECITTVIYLIFYPREAVSSTNIQEIITTLRVSEKNILNLVIAIILLTFVIELLWNGYSFKLIDVVGGDKTLFGLVYATLPAITGVIGRFAAGKLVDDYNPILILSITTILLATVISGIHFLTGLFVILLWSIPTYSFYDLASAVSISRSLYRNQQSTAIGIFSLATSIGGILLLLMSILIPQVTIFQIYIISIIAIIITLILLIQCYNQYNYQVLRD